MQLEHDAAVGIECWTFNLVWSGGQQGRIGFRRADEIESERKISSLMALGK